MKLYSLLIFLFGCIFSFAQEKIKDSTMVDFHYREDQFYIGLTYDLLTNKPEGVIQQNFSRGIHLGMVRDMPINKKRTIAVATGLGYSYNLVYSNVLSLRQNNETYYFIGNLQKNDISKNYFEMHGIEVPLEVRFRTSTPYSHKFWRAYLGMKVAYIYSAKNSFTQKELEISFNNPNIMNSWQIKAYGAFGYNTWNFYIQYLFLPIYKNQKTDKGQNLSMNILQLGLIFYIL